MRFLRDPHGPDLSRLVDVLVEVGLVAGLALASILVIVAAVVLIGLERRRRLAREGTSYRLRLPEEFDRARLAQVLASVAVSLRRRSALLVGQPYMGFELRAFGSRLEPIVFCSGGIAAGPLLDVIGEALPGARLEPADATPRRFAGVRRATSLVPLGREQAPLRTDFATDPSGLIVRGLAAHDPDEGGGVHVLFAPAGRRAHARLLSEAARLRGGRPRRSVFGMVLDLALGLLRELFSFFDPPRTTSYAKRPSAVVPSPWEREHAGALAQKAAEPLFACTVRLGVWGSSRRETQARLSLLAAAYAQFRGEGGLRPSREPRLWRRLERRLLPLRPPLLLAASEPAALCPFPERVSEAPVAFEHAPAHELGPDAAAPRAGLLLGESEARGRREPVYVTAEGLLQHAHLLGPTGSGKSTLLLNLAVQAMEQGFGLALFEPKGDLCVDVLARVPRERMADVVPLDFADADYPPACNLLAGAAERGQAESLSAIFSRLFGSNWGPRSEDLLRAAIATLIASRTEGEEPTLADVLPLLSDARARGRHQVHDRVVLAGFWRAWEQASEGARQQAIAPLANKLRAFLLREPLRDALVQPEAPDLLSTVRDRKILLCSLSASALGEDGASLFGSVLLHRLWHVAQALGPAGGRRDPFLCLIDECHRFAALPGGMADLLAEARGYGLGFVLAHQELFQLPSDLRQAVAANCRTKLCFQLDPPDHERMAEHFAPRLSAADLLHLDRFQLACRVFERGLVLPPATAVAAPPPPIEDEHVAELIRLRTRGRGRSKAEIEALIEERFPESARPDSTRAAPARTRLCSRCGWVAACAWVGGTLSFDRFPGVF